MLRGDSAKMLSKNTNFIAMILKLNLYAAIALKTETELIIKKKFRIKCNDSVIHTRSLELRKKFIFIFNLHYALANPTQYSRIYGSNSRRRKERRKKPTDNNTLKSVQCQVQFYH